jgi:hypothetical protein
MAPTPNFRTRHSTWVSRLVVANIKRRRSYKCAERHNHSHEQFGNIDKGINLWWARNIQRRCQALAEAAIVRGIQ